MKPHRFNQPRRVNHSQPYSFRFPDAPAHCLAVAAVIRSLDLTHQLPRRNALALESFKCLDFREFRYSNRSQSTPREYMVETWWDTSSKNWITQVSDHAGNQLGDADYSGNVGSAALAHFSAIARTFLGPAPKVRESQLTYTVKHDQHRSLILHGVTAEVCHQFLCACRTPSEYTVSCDANKREETETLGGDEWLDENTDLLLAQ